MGFSLQQAVASTLIVALKPPEVPDVFLGVWEGSEGAIVLQKGVLFYRKALLRIRGPDLGCSCVRLTMWALIF